MPSFIPKISASRLLLIVGALLLGVLLVFAGLAKPAAASCGGTTTVSNAAQLNAAIAAFNGASGPCVFTIRLTQDINLTASTTAINNANSDGRTGLSTVPAAYAATRLLMAHT